MNQMEIFENAMDYIDGVTINEGSTEDAAKSLSAIINALKDDKENEILKMAKDMKAYYDKEGSFSPKQAEWIYKTSKAIFKK